MKPVKPHKDFPLGAWPNGQWGKKINSKPYYFGTWADDPKGVAALKDYQARIAGILAGTDHLRGDVASEGQMSMGQLYFQFTTQKRTEMQAGQLSPATLAGYIRQLDDFLAYVGTDVSVASLKPEHFNAYAATLLTRSFKSHSRKNAFAAIKGMVRWGAGNGFFTMPNFGSSFKSPKTTVEAIRKERARAGVPDNTDRIATGAEIDKLLALAQPNLRAIILMGVNAGLGPADIGRLHWRHINFENGMLRYPRRKTGNLRIGYLWKRTREALLAVRKLKHTKAAIEKDGEDALVFVTKKRQPYYRETEIVKDGRVVGVQISNAISITFGRLTKKADLAKGLSFYRLRHTFKTLGKKARDRDALNLAMGHKGNTIEEGYDHEFAIEVPWRRVKRVSKIVRQRLWPKPKQSDGTGGVMRIVGGDAATEAA